MRNENKMKLLNVKKSGVFGRKRSKQQNSTRVEDKGCGKVKDMESKYYKIIMSKFANAIFHHSYKP